MMKVYLSLGSNEGDRKANIDKALEMLDALPATMVLRVSDIIESEPQGLWDEKAAGGRFMNACCCIGTALAPLRLLEEVKNIERALGRDGAVRYDSEGARIYSDRPIDIDILLYGRRRICTPTLQIPHPHMQERDFVTIPLKQIKY